jgi:hypothetical protein
MSHSSPFRTLALVLAVVMVVLAAAPARAEAMEPLTIIALVGLAVAGVVLIAYLIIANVEGPKMADESPRMADEGPKVVEEESPKLADEGRMILAAPIPES